MPSGRDRRRTVFLMKPRWSDILLAFLREGAVTHHRCRMRAAVDTSREVFSGFHEL